MSAVTRELKARAQRFYCGALRRKLFENSFVIGILGTEDHRQTASKSPTPGPIFASNDAGQTRFGALKTLASKWGLPPQPSGNLR